MILVDFDNNMNDLKKGCDFCEELCISFVVLILLCRSTSLAFWTGRKTVLEVKNHFEVRGEDFPKSDRSAVVIKLRLIDIPYLNRFEFSGQHRVNVESRNFLF